MWTWILAAMLVGCGPATKRLSDDEFDHYYALRVFMNEDQKKTYLKMKTREERDTYLKENGLWDRFYQYDEAKREMILTEAPARGWTKDMLYMSLGAPYDQGRLVGRKAARSQRLVYRFEQQEDGSVLVWQQGSKTEYKAVRLFTREYIVDDDVITEINEETTSW
ncbi:MAG: hypothetical protein AAFV53_05650 [Myxococcota bacterium]